MEECKKILNEMIKEEYTAVLDLGSGKTSMSALLEKFKSANISGICFPNDTRKTESIKAECNGNYNLIEMDICKEAVKDNFEFVLCHLIFGEATKFNNTIGDMANSVFDIPTSKILLIDYLEDPEVDFDIIIDVAKIKGYYISRKEIFKKEVAEDFLGFKAENYLALLFEKRDW